MKRWLLAPAVLIGVSLAVAHAEYVMIHINLGAKSQEKTGPGMGGMPGMMGGMMGMAGGMPGMMGGMPGMAGGMPGMMGGMPGMGGPGGGMRGMPMMPGMPGGGRGAPGMPMPGGMGMAGMGMAGMAGGMPGMPGMFTNIANDVDLTTIRAHVVVEMKGKRVKNIRGFPTIDTKWGTTMLTQTKEFTPVLVRLPPVLLRFTNLEAYKKAKKTPDDYLELTQWALSHGLLEQVPKLMAELAVISPNHPVVAAFHKVEDAIKAPITNTAEDQSRFWVEKLGNYKVEKSRHYSLLYKEQKDKGVSLDVKSRLDRLEQNYRAFFYWFALKDQVDKALPVPNYRLVAVLVDGDDFHFQNKVFGSEPIIADGFYARRDNLVVFSATRLDEAYEALSKAHKDMWSKGWEWRKLLKGKGRLKNTDDRTFAEMQMVALVLKAMQAESELASVSYEATRQLAAAIGLLPRTVDVPQWLQFGFGSFFQTPEGSFWGGTGAPSQKYLAKYKVWELGKKLDRSDIALPSVVTDRYFRDWLDNHNKASLLKAQTMSWSLTYFLMQKHLRGMLRYCRELANLPRDVEFDDAVLMQCFARAFDLVNAAKPNVVDEVKLHGLAMEWYSFIRETPGEVPEGEKITADQQKNQRNQRPGQRRIPGQRPPFSPPGIGRPIRR